MAEINGLNLLPMVFIWDLKNAIWMDEQSRAGNTCVPINLHDIRRDFVSPECVSAMNHTARSISGEWNFPSESTRRRRRRRTFVPRVVQSGSEFSAIVLKLYFLFFIFFAGKAVFRRVCTASHS